MSETIEAIDTIKQTDVQQIMQQAARAFDVYKNIPAKERAAFLETIASEIEQQREALVATANKETNLPLPRLNGELTRTTNQLKLFAALITEGSWVEASIDTADATRTPPRPDIRKMLVPLGTIVVFGASNFPFAFSTAGGDTASALAAGCSVVVKGHPAHLQTSSMVFEAIEKAIQKANMPQFVVQHTTAEGNDIGKALVTHPVTKAVGFTGSFHGGKALYDYATQCEQPIPVFAEMSSINPVVLYPDTLAKNAETLAATYAASITLGVGQFCTNPGILLGIKSEGLTTFINSLGKEIEKVAPQRMLHEGIYNNYRRASYGMQQQQGLQVVGESATQAGDEEAAAFVASVSGEDFISNPHLSEEVFGPYSLVVLCDDKVQLMQALQTLKGQLTTTLMATEQDIAAHADVIALQQTLAGRIILNNVPTGVEVCASMVHGGPFPATTDARFTSVGSTAIKRWVRPVCFQNFTDAMLPDALKNSNPLNIMRIINDVYTRDTLG